MRIGQGQSFVEYVFLIVAITTALFAMQVYVRRGIQAKTKDILISSDFLNFSSTNANNEEFANVVNVVNVVEKKFEQLILKDGKLEYVREENTLSNSEKK